MKKFKDSLDGNNSDVMQVDLRPTLSRENVYTQAQKHVGDVPSSGTVNISKKFEISGANELHFITGGAFPATEATVKFYMGEYADSTAEATVSIPLGVAGEFAKTAITIPNVVYDTHVMITMSFSAGDYELFLGKIPLS